MDILLVLKLALLLGLVIFVHELGHFLVARWCGVLVERFSIGFGPVLFSFKRGDTEYALSLIPLGGYVKMLGQVDNPAEHEVVMDDPRSYQRKSVAARMAIISAGVVMNLIFGFIFFAVAYHIGVPYSPAVVGTAAAGEPAWIHGLRSGDEVVAINGHRPTDFGTLRMEVALTNPSTETVNFVVKRGDNEREVRIQPTQQESKPAIGVLPSLGLRIHDQTDLPATMPYSPAALAKPAFARGDTIVAVDGEPVTRHFALVEKLFAKQKEAVTFTVRRQEQPGSKRTQDLAIVVEPNFVRTLGLHMQPGSITAVQQGSPAALAVDAQEKPAPITLNDTIVAVDGITDIDPMRLPDVITAKAGQRIELTLLRKGQVPRQEKVYLTPQAIPTWIDYPQMGFVDDWPLSIPALGIAYNVLPTVRWVVPDSPAASAETPLQAEDVIKRIEFTSELTGKKEKETHDLATEKGEKGENWPMLFWAMQFSKVRTVKLTVDRQGQTLEVTLTPREDKTWPLWMRGMLFDWAEGLRQETNVAQAVRLGFERTRSSTLQMYLTLRGLLYTRTISPRNLSGPISIFETAYRVGQRSFGGLIEFMALLSINLAVLNFLPIPILDGGHMMFLAYEALRGKPASERAFVIGSYIGLLIIAGLMLFVFTQDILRAAGWMM